MPVDKIVERKPSKVSSGPRPLPDEISPTAYLKQFAEHLASNLGSSAKPTVHLRIAWLHANSLEEDGVVSYGELGLGQNQHTLQQGFNPLKKLFLRGTVPLYRSDQRWGGLKPFDPDEASEVEVTVWVATGVIELKFPAEDQVWTVPAKYAPASNLLYGFPTGAGAPQVKPMVMLSLAKKTTDVVK